VLDVVLFGALKKTRYASHYAWRGATGCRIPNQGLPRLHIGIKVGSGLFLRSAQISDTRSFSVFLDRYPKERNIVHSNSIWMQMLISENLEEAWDIRQMNRDCHFFR
jgi:hypothetical protein